MSKEFPGKILLFGEYTIIIGSKALVLPFRKFSGRLEMPSEDREPVGSGSQPGQTDAQRSNDDLLGLLQYLEKLQAAGYMLGDFDIGRFMEQVIGGLYFHSSIPEAYGALQGGLDDRNADVRYATADLILNAYLREPWARAVGGDAS